MEHDSSDAYPLELTTKSSHENNRVLTSSSSNIQNLMVGFCSLFYYFTICFPVFSL